VVTTNTNRGFKGLKMWPELLTARRSRSRSKMTEERAKSDTQAAMEIEQNDGPIGSFTRVGREKQVEAKTRRDRGPAESRIKDSRVPKSRLEKIRPEGYLDSW